MNQFHQFDQCARSSMPLHGLGQQSAQARCVLLRKCSYLVWPGKRSFQKCTQISIGWCQYLNEEVVYVRIVIYLYTCIDNKREMDLVNRAISHKLNLLLRALIGRSLPRLSQMAVFMCHVTINDYWLYIYPCKLQ